MMEGNEIALEQSPVTYHDAGKGRIVFGGILAALAAAAMVILGVYMVRLPVTDETLEKTGGIMAFAKVWELTEALMDGGLPSVDNGWIGYFIAAVTAPVLGLLAGFMDEALCRLPLGCAVRSRLGFSVRWYVRLAPALLFAVYFFIYLVITAFKPEVQFLMPKFSLTGERYTGGMWFTQVFIFLIALTFLVMLAEAFVNAGPIGFLLRAPLLFATNLVVSLLLCFVAVLAFSIVMVVLFLIVLFFAIRVMTIISIFSR